MTERAPSSRGAHADSLIERLGVLAESRVVRTGLVVLIILSVLPYTEIEEAFRWVFLAAFGIELALRIPLLMQRRRKKRAGAGELAFLFIDIAAFLSFLPLEEWFHQHFSWLVFMRLARLAVLLRFAKELAADLYSILTRREQLQQFGLVTVAVAALAFVSAVVLSQLAIPHDYDGTSRVGEDFWERMWWSFRQLESADNLVANLHVHPVVGVLSLVLTVIGVFIISFIIGIGTNVVEQVVRAERRRLVGYRGHTVVIGPVAESEILVREFVAIYSKNRRDFRDQLRKLWRWLISGAEAPRAWRLPRMALLGPDAEPPGFLLEPGMRWVLYRQGLGGDGVALARIGGAHAKRAILLGDRSAGQDADAITVSTLAALREINPHAHVFLELFSSRNASTLDALGEGTRTFHLDVSWFLGLFILHHLAIPGVERLYRLLLTAEGSELYSHVYLSESELEGLAQLADEDGFVSSHLLAGLAERHGVILVGVFLGEGVPEPGEHDLVPIEGLVPWLNPHADPYDPRVSAHEGSGGRVPADRIRGLIGVGDTYQPLRNYARALTQHRGDGEEAPAALEVTVEDPRPAPRHVLVVGQAEPIASLTERLAQLVERSRVTVAVDSEPRHVHLLMTALSQAGITLEPEGTGHRAGLVRDGRIEVISHPHDAMEAALAVLRADAPVEAVVFLAEGDAPDPDARTALRLMRLAEHLLSNERRVPQVLAELTSLPKGERVRREVEAAFRRAGREAPHITLVSTEQVRNYFMVHSAFVPGINEVYAQILGGHGQDLVRLPLAGKGSVQMRSVRHHLAQRQMVALGLELEDGEVVLNPAPDTTFRNARAVFAIGEPADGADG
ncbi:MAG: hypothetical protein AB8I08_25115 [Sandaracinaceae bacterium]